MGMPEAYWNWVDRNLGIITKEEQEKLSHSTVAVAGCGGMGGLLAVQLARIGIGRIKIADNQKFEISNCNRQYSCRMDTIGKSKALCTFHDIKRIAGDMVEVDVFPSGVNRDNAEEFVRGSDLILDEIEFYEVAARIFLHQAARHAKRIVLNCNVVGFGTRIFRFAPDTMTVEQFLSADENSVLNPELIERLISRLAPRLPADIKREILLSWVLNPDPSQRKVPIFGATPLISAGIVAVRSVFEILGYKDRPWIRPLPPMPGYAFFDAATFESGTYEGKWW